MSKFAREDEYRDFLIQKKITLGAGHSNLVTCTICHANHDRHKMRVRYHPCGNPRCKEIVNAEGERQHFFYFSINFL
jgi:hypothetical protein